MGFTCRVLSADKDRLQYLFFTRLGLIEQSDSRLHPLDDQLENEQIPSLLFIQIHKNNNSQN